MSKYYLPLRILILLILLPQISFARISKYEAYGPLRTRSQNPLYLNFLAMPMEAPITLDRGQMESDVQTTFSNVFEFNNVANTQVNLDMEIWRTALTYGYGITDQLDIKTELGFLSTGGGFLDSFIQSYHNAFGFPNGGRDVVSNNSFNYSVIDNGTTLVNHSSNALGFSDLTLRAKYLFLTNDNFPFQIALLPYLKLPTGQTSSGFSSGRVDGGLSVLGQYDLGNRWHFVTHLGGVILGGHKDLSSIVGPAFFSFGQSVEFQILDGFSTIVQLTGNTSAFKNVDAAELSQAVMDLNIGFAGNFDLHKLPLQQFYYQFAFSEDVMSTGPSVDFSTLFLVGVRY